MRLALYQPEIPQNTGTLLRLGACFGVSIDIIEPCGFVFSHRLLKRSGMDYIDKVDYHLHPSWEDFQGYKPHQRRVLLTPSTEMCYTQFQYDRDDILVVGRESSGVPDTVLSTFTERVKIPMRPGTRSLNVAVAASIVLCEALRQTNQLPEG